MSNPVAETPGVQESDQDRLSRIQKQKPQPLSAHRKDAVPTSRPVDVPDSRGLGAHPGVSHTLDPASPPRQGNIAAAQIAQAVNRRSSSPFSRGISPHRGTRSSSPRHLSPATSQIFERDVQESTLAPPELSPAIPSHIQTEDHIPPVLEASSLAITENMDPDEVEIVMHSAHQPAGAGVANNSLGDAPASAHGSHTDLGVHMDHDETGSNYGAVDPMDPRRLSFISFADVVNAEHAESGMTGFSSASPSAGNRSPSPIRSPSSPDKIAISPPTSGSISFKGGEASPVRGGGLSVMSSGGTPHGELTIETMRQTLKKTGSNDVGGTGAGSQPMSATSADDMREQFLK